MLLYTHYVHSTYHGSHPVCCVHPPSAMDWHTMHSVTSRLHTYELTPQGHRACDTGHITVCTVTYVYFSNHFLCDYYCYNFIVVNCYFLFPHPILSKCNTAISRIKMYTVIAGLYSAPINRPHLLIFKRKKKLYINKPRLSISVKRSFRHRVYFLRSPRAYRARKHTEKWAVCVITERNRRMTSVGKCPV